MLSSKQVREKWHEFRESKWHKHAKPVSLIADSENKSVLFTVAGMQPFVPYLVGKPHPLGKRLFNIQKCIRTNDIDDIGDERHCSMFEMMGNRSLGDYFKKDAIVRSLEFLVDVLGIDKSKLWATIFAWDSASGIPRDDESHEVLASLGIKHIKEMTFDEYGESDNFWTPWPVGPCGPCVEFYFDRWDDAFGPADWDMGVNDRYTEVRNNVMMAYYRDGSGSTEPGQQNVDTGMWFERLNMLLQWTETIFETDIFANSIQTIQWFTDTKYNDHKQQYRIILDHFRASTFLICDGVVPSNEGRWYVLRRLIRRWYFNFSKLSSATDEVFEKFVDIMVTGIIDDFAPRYENMEGNTKLVVQLLIKECQNFQQTISNGLGELDKLIKKWNISWVETFRLFESFGLPRDVIKDVLLSHNLKADKEAFDIEAEKAKELSRQSATFVKNTERSKYLGGIPETQFIGYDQLKEESVILLKDFSTDQWQRVLIFDKTPFYATGWGQIGDNGRYIDEKWNIIRIKEVVKYAWVYLHFTE